MDWATSEWGSCLLGDKRLTDRAVKVGAALLTCSCSSMPKQMKDWADLNGAYRLLGHDRATHESLSVGHWERTCEYARSPGLGVVLFIQDTTTLDYSSHPNTVGLGFTGNGSGYGIEVHSALCVIPGDKPEVVGLARQTPWTRDHAPRGKSESDADLRKRRTEHDIWKETLESIGSAPGNDSGTFWLSVGDRGSDVFSYISRANLLGWHVLVRSKFNRILTDNDVEERKLHDRMRALSPQAKTLVSLRARPGVPARIINLNVAWTQVTVPQPKSRGGDGPQEINCIRVWEEGGKEQKPEPLEWILLTSLPTQDLEQVLLIIGYYRQRWLIEEYHKCLKTGCNIEKRQVATKAKLLALLGFFSIVSIYLLQFKAPLKGRHIPPDLLQVVQLLSPKTNAKDLTNPDNFWRQVAMIGGFLGRKGDGDPGWQAIWTGWNRLQDIYFGFQLAGGTSCV
jgi:hypothetical protein